MHVDAFAASLTLTRELAQSCGIQTLPRELSVLSLKQHKYKKKVVCGVRPPASFPWDLLAYLIGCSCQHDRIEFCFLQQSSSISEVHQNHTKLV